ncbi:hypothetical protein ACEWY4_008502 [Coilia grayii]|uniref:Integrase core domain-containing protein n=1 Tax=Coilia grayii TaxID=363190 RepID=A0ABD1KB84_9TELE
MSGMIDRLIRQYFDQGLTQAEIALSLLIRDNIKISPRHLRRRLARLRLYRQRYSDPAEVVDFICKLMNGPGRLHGYRMMHARCLLAGFRVSRDFVAEIPFIIIIIIQNTLDPEAVRRRKGRRLRRRSYSVLGPNYVWHMDSYEKLTPFGIGVNRCIDGFSRRIWMEANCTNPCVIAAYFTQAVSKLGGCPKILRSDNGTENVHANRLQTFFREDHTGEVHGPPCVIQGRSTPNQRIECWWGPLRRQNVDYWRDVFREFQATGHFRGDFIDKGLIQFCFLKIIQDELDTVVQMWDNHRIRRGRNGRDLYHGKPVIMYNVPELYHSQNYLHPVEMDKINTVIGEDICQWKTDTPCDINLHDLCLLVMEQHNLTRRPGTEGAIKLYKDLRPLIKALLEEADD